MKLQTVEHLAGGHSEIPFSTAVTQRLIKHKVWEFALTVLNIFHFQFSLSGLKTLQHEL